MLKQHQQLSVTMDHSHGRHRPNTPLYGTSSDVASKGESLAEPYPGCNTPPHPTADAALTWQVLNTSADAACELRKQHGPGKQHANEHWSRQMLQCSAAHRFQHVLLTPLLERTSQKPMFAVHELQSASTHEAETTLQFVNGTVFEAWLCI